MTTVTEVFKAARDHWGWKLSTETGRRQAFEHLHEEDAYAFIKTLLDLIEVIDQPHTIKIDGLSWSIKHSLACRDDMQNCEYNLAAPALVHELDGSWNGEFGLYFTHDDDDEDAEPWLMLGDRIER